MSTGEIPNWLQGLVARMHGDIRAVVRDDLASTSAAELSRPVRAGAGDVSFAIDVRPEKIVEKTFAQTPEPVVVICEGLGRTVFPTGGYEREAAWLVVVDPLDGSREISYGKRSAWILTGVAPAGHEQTLRTIEWAMQTEVPPLDQDRAVVLAAAADGPATMEHLNLAAGTRTAARALAPSDADTIEGGFAIVADYFAGLHEITGRFADTIIGDVLGHPGPGETLVYNDQYLSSAGCLHLLASGRYRFFADLRPLLWEAARPGAGKGLCAHPYDLCTALIAERAGVVVTDPAGRPLAYPLTTDADCAWVGYANARIREQVEPALSRAIHDLGPPLRPPP